ncbi:hypothetical protein TVAG_229180 [Trichomonas vaginalis G3]|uniref:Uncharacterized protein n=1 Tax=Trichomonas vaginalis (strain ATCC PRA-98 / G3) TaxID=412133 RepID=A2FBQ4_TRIV3|nr:serine-type peptidase protein [Trichomonas vaginalis G3]EAX97651.1 hypothetical protein TVAG_229180 [Trichomonas vaginalis G3]KAI5510353.1 serine-type peptidase protein [Trichomonas vaginalis G3]|eukprot:XP_001310581.1 hypothetical protein [Trichomonas vaginalis G3]
MKKGPYIKCNEISSFPCAGKNAEWRDIDIAPAYWTSVCTDLFNITKLANATVFNDKYGGRFPPAERTYFVHGFNDAFLEASCTIPDDNIDKKVDSILESGFSDDLNPEQETDSPQLKKIRQKVINTMINWIQFDPTPRPSPVPTQSPSPSPKPSSKPTETLPPNPTQTVIP